MKSKFARHNYYSKNKTKANICITTIYRNTIKYILTIKKHLRNISIIQQIVFSLDTQKN